MIIAAICPTTEAVLSSLDNMKYSNPSDRMAACGKRTARATSVLLLALALLGTSAPAVTFTWNGGSIGGAGDSDGLEKLSLDTESGTITFGGDVRPNSDSGSALILSPGGIKGNRNAMTFGGTGDITIRRMFSGTASPLPYEGDTMVKAGKLMIAANVANAADGADRTMGHATSAVLIGDTSLDSFSTLLTECGFRAGRAGATESRGLSMPTPGRTTKAGDGTVVQNGEERVDVRPVGGTFDSAGGILDANDQNENTIGALSFTANSTLDMHAGDGAASPRLDAASTTGGTLPMNGWSDPADTSRPDDNLFIMADAATSGALSQIEFTSDAPRATRLGGQIVPVPEPTNIALGVFGAIVVLFGIGRRLYARANTKSCDHREAAGPSFSTERSDTRPHAENIWIHENLR